MTTFQLIYWTTVSVSVICFIAGFLNKEKRDKIFKSVNNMVDLVGQNAAVTITTLLIFSVLFIPYLNTAFLIYAIISKITRKNG